MARIVEPDVRVPASVVIELIQCWRRSVNEQGGNEAYDIFGKFDWYYEEAERKLKSYNRRTMSDS